MPATGNAQVTQAWLHSSWQVKVPQTWLEACVDWVQEEAGGVGVPQAQLNQQVLDQWLLTDLRDLAHPVLPAGVTEAQKMELNGCYCLQVDSLLDVSQPAYSQLQRVRGADCTNEQVTAVTQATQKPWEAKPTRMLMLQLTDGVQSLEGMEYRPIPALNTSLPPGTKLQLIGTVVVRLGVLLLKAENVRVLGGEVEQLVERQSQAKVLCRTLGLPEEDHQQGAEPDDQELLANVEALREPQLGGSTSDSGYDSNGGTLMSQASVRNDRSQSYRLEPSHQATPASSSRNVVDPPDEDFQDIPDNFDYVPDDFDDIPDNFDYVPDDFDDIPDNFDEVPENFSNAQEDFDDIPMEELDSIMTPADLEVLPRSRGIEYGGTGQQPVPSSDRQVSQPRNGGSSHSSFASGAPVNESNSNRVGSSAEMADLGPSDDSLTSPEPKIPRYEPVFTSTQSGTQLSAHKRNRNANMSVLNYLCILQNDPWPPSTVQVVRLQAFIVTLVGNLRCSGGVWKLGATISDGTGYLDVDLSDALLAKLIGFSAAESRALRKDPAKRGVVEAGIQNCQRELVDMCCVMNVRLEPSGNSVVLKTDPLTDRECCELQRRVTERRT
ncbi:recQ-mediated genome instability protein 1 [Salminus brasiliensis]|uniref:recQ-mediated genome instability protein 1 n=1 Tax=Salminus brasiliensis TaxID=930266 RepID=UPI003B832D53